MKAFFDSSAYSKRFFDEKGSDAVEEICSQTTSLALSIISIPEIVSALNRHLRESTISEVDYSEIKRVIFEDIKDVVIINITPNVITRSISILEHNVARAMDALHVACAIEWGSDLFVSSDRRQIQAAIKEGLRYQFIS